MMYKTTLAAAQFNTFNGTGRHFYLVTAADKVVFKFLNKSGSVQFQSEFREGMSVDFPAQAHSVVVETETAQYIEFWFGDSKLDYMSLAAGGASAGIQSGRAICELGKTLAVAADFRRKAITLQAVTDVGIGGIDIDVSNAFKLVAGEKTPPMKMRGDIYSYLPPARINTVDSVTTEVTCPTVSEAGAVRNVDSLRALNYAPDFDSVLAVSGQIKYSLDKGVTWLTATHKAGAAMGASTVWEYAGQSPDGIFYFAGLINDYGRVVVTRDGGKTVLPFCGLAGANYSDGTEIGNNYVYCAWISPDEKNLILGGKDYIFESFDSGKTWDEYSVPWKLIKIVKYDGKIYGIREGTDYLYEVFKDGTAPRFVGGDPGGGGTMSLIAVNGHLFWYGSTLKKLYHLDESGTLSQVTLTEDHKAEQVIQVGESIVICGLNMVGILSTPDDEVLWVNASTDASIVGLGKTKGNCGVWAGDCLIVRAASSYSDPDTVATVYPATLTEGETLPVALQWLAEIN